MSARDFLKVILFFVSIIFFCGMNFFSAAERKYIYISGSSTVSPFAVVSGEYFSKFSDYPIPVVEAIGTGGGIKLFCNGLSLNYPDIAIASREISQSELSLCSSNGINDVKEHIVGYDAVVLIRHHDNKIVSLTDEELFLALSKYSVVNNKLIPNKYKYWSEISPHLPKDKIIVLGPSINSGTREIFVKQAMTVGMNKFLQDNNLIISDEDKRLLSHSLRDDGSFIQSGENGNVIIQRILNKPKSIGIVGYSFIIDNESISPIAVNNELPSKKTISNSKYSLRRPLFLYVKERNMQGIDKFVDVFMNNKTTEKMGLIKVN